MLPPDEGIPLLGFDHLGPPPGVRWMSFRDLESIGLAEFVRRERAPEALWGFVHIPKTAGVALVAAVNRQRRPYFNIFPAAYEDSPAAYWAAYDDAAERFLRAYPNRDAAGGPGWFSGHLQRRQIDRILTEMPDVKLVTYLREPVARVISDYRYCLTPAHPLRESFVRQYPRLMDFVAAQPNKQSKYIAGAAATSADAVIDFASRRFAFIGAVEAYEASNRVFASLLGLPSLEPRQVNVTLSIPANDIEVTEDDRQAIADVNQLDLSLHRHVVALLASRVEAVAGSVV